jgi:hypothetical protein
MTFIMLQASALLLSAPMGVVLCFWRLGEGGRGASTRHAAEPARV